VPLLDRNSAEAEQAYYYANVITGFFASEIRKNGCLTPIPITLYHEADGHISQIEDIDEIVNAPDQEIYKAKNNAKNVYLKDPLSEAIKRSIGQNCLSCKPSLPKIAFTNTLDDTINNALNFIDKLKNYSLDINTPSIAFTLNSFCIPDLLSLLAVIVAALAKIAFALDFSKFNIMSFIMAIIGRLLAILSKFADVSLKISLSPIMCIIDALIQLSTTVGKTAEGVGDQIKKAKKEYAEKSMRERAKSLAKKVEGAVDIRFMGESVTASSINKDSQQKIQDISDGIKKEDSNKSDISKFAEELQELKDVIELGVKSIEDTIIDVFGISQYMLCESARCTSRASDDYDGIMKFISLINLIRSIIKRKTRKIASNITRSGSYESVDPSSAILSNDEIYSAIAEAIGRNLEIAESDGSDIGIIIGKPIDDISVKPLTIFGCNLGDIIQDSHLNVIIKDAKEFAEGHLIGKGNDPTYVSRPLDNISTNTDFIPLDIDNNLNDVIKNIFSFLNVTNPYVDGEAPPLYDSQPGSIADRAEELRLKIKENRLSLEESANLRDSLDDLLGNIGNIRI